MRKFEINSFCLGLNIVTIALQIGNLITDRNTEFAVVLLNGNYSCFSISANSSNEEKVDSMNDKIFEKYEKCINQIQDYLEYRYALVDREDVRRTVLNYIDNMTDEISIMRNKEKSK